MARASVRIDYAGIGRILRSSEMAAAVDGAAQAVAAALPSSAEVYVHPFTTDRAGAVVIAAGNTPGNESKSGLLASAATRAGLEFRGTP